MTGGTGFIGRPTVKELEGKGHKLFLLVRKKNEGNLFSALYAAKASLYWLGSKVAADRGMKLIWARIFFAYGLGQRAQSLIPYVMSSVRRGEVPQLKNLRGGNDFVYVDDVARALRMLAEKSRSLESAAYNSGSGRLTSVAGVAGHIYHLERQAAPTEFSVPQESSGFYANISKIKERNWLGAAFGY